MPLPMKKLNWKKSFALMLIASFVSFGFIMASDVGQKKKKKKNDAEYELITSNVNGKGINLKVTFTRGKSHNHPMMAVWIEDVTGKYIQTLFVNQSVATSTYQYGDKKGGKWKPGVVRRPAALPYWSHKRGIKAPDGYYMPTPDDPVPDAYTGPTPQKNFILSTRPDEPLSESFNLLFEINQPWDWNKFWTNNKYPDNEHYKTSSQPALVYSVTVDPSVKDSTYTMKVIGHSHYSGADGELYTDLSTITSAMEIAESIKVHIISE